MAVSAIKIVQGEDVAVTIDLKDHNTGLPFSLAGFTGATAYFPAVTGGGLPVQGLLVSADLGRVTFALNEVQTAAVLDGDGQNIEVVVDQGAQRAIAQILGKLNVAARLF